MKKVDQQLVGFADHLLELTGVLSSLRWRRWYGGPRGRSRCYRQRRSLASLGSGNIWWLFVVIDRGGDERRLHSLESVVDGGGQSRWPPVRVQSRLKWMLQANESLLVADGYGRSPRWK